MDSIHLSRAFTTLKWTLRMVYATNTRQRYSLFRLSQAFSMNSLVSWLIKLIASIRVRRNTIHWNVGQREHQTNGTWLCQLDDTAHSGLLTLPTVCLVGSKKTKQTPLFPMKQRYKILSWLVCLPSAWLELHCLVWLYHQFRAASRAHTAPKPL